MGSFTEYSFFLLTNIVFFPDIYVGRYAMNILGFSGEDRIYYCENANEDMLQFWCEGWRKRAAQSFVEQGSEGREKWICPSYFILWVWLSLLFCW